MNFDQIHIILDIAATVGGIVIACATYYVRSIVTNAKFEILEMVGQLRLEIKDHAGTCNAERAELYRMNDYRGRGH